MRSVLSVTGDKELLESIRKLLDGYSAQSYFAESQGDIALIVNRNEVACAVIDCSCDDYDVREICRELISANENIMIIGIFSGEDTGKMLEIYNEFPVYGLMLREDYSEEVLTELMEKCFDEYKSVEDSGLFDSVLRDIEEKYMRPLSEMSEILNERITGYSFIVGVFKKSVDFIVDTSERILNLVDEFVDIIINDFINIYMLSDTPVNEYVNKLGADFNNPSEMKYLSIVCNDVNDDTLNGEAAGNVMFILDLITNGFNVFYPHYRGKITVSRGAKGVEINSLYEVRTNKEIADVYKYVTSVIRNSLKMYCDDSKFAEKDKLIQFKATINC